MPVLDLDAIADAQRFRHPYPFFYGGGAVRREYTDPLAASFPNLRNPGYLTLQDDSLTGAFGEMIATLQSESFADLVSDMLQFDLSHRPTLITVMNLCPRSAGRIHTDSKSKLATILIYLNREWPAGHQGCVRALYGPDSLNEFAIETPPLFGNFFGFVRSEHSWHGHLPYAGPRRVVQLTWLDGEAALKRRQHNNNVAQRLKTISGFWRRA